MLKFSSKIQITDEQRALIIGSLPQDWETDVREVDFENDIEIFIRISAKTVTDIQNWILTYQRITNSTYSVESTYKCSGQRVIFKRSFHCQHRTRHKDTYDPIHRKSIKNTNCPAKLSVVLRTIKKRYQGKDKSRAPDHNKPCEIRLKLKHNHSTTNSMALKFKKVLPEVREELLKLYKQGHKPATALRTLKANIRLNNENFADILADRSKCPDYSYCHYLYQKTLANLRDTTELDEKFLGKKLDEYNKRMDEICAKMVSCTEGFVVCFCPPLVKRIHQHLSASAEKVFIESFLTCEKNGGRIFIMLAESVCGGLPLGAFITSSEASQEIKYGFVLLKEMLGESAFSANINGPKVFLSDEFLTEQNFLNTIWPNSRNLLSVFRVLQNVWRWLLVGKNNIASTDRSVLFRDFYSMLYASSEVEFLQKFQTAKQNGAKFKNYVKLLNAYFDKRQLWALCYRSNLRKENVEGNYSEVVMRVLRDKIFQRLKTFSTVQLVDFVMNNFFRYFEMRLLDVAYNRSFNNMFFDKIQKPPDKILEGIQTLGRNIRLVPSEKMKDLYYMVNTDLLTCTCFNGNSDSVCKHVQWVCMLLCTNHQSENFTNVELRQKCYFMATGEDPPENLLDAAEESAEIHEENDLILVEVQEQEQNSPEDDLHEEICEMEETSNVVEMDEYLLIKQKEHYIKECKSIWEKVSQRYEELLRKSPENLLPVLKVVASSFQTASSASDLSSGVDSFESGDSTCQSKRKIEEQNASEGIKKTKMAREEENVELITNLSFLM